MLSIKFTGPGTTCVIVNENREVIAGPYPSAVAARDDLVKKLVEQADRVGRLMRRKKKH